jgi:hypothetical protein
MMDVADSPETLMHSSQITQIPGDGIIFTHRQGPTLDRIASLPYKQIFLNKTQVIFVTEITKSNTEQSIENSLVEVEEKI